MGLQAAMNKPNPSAAIASEVLLNPEALLNHDALLNLPSFMAMNQPFQAWRKHICAGSIAIADLKRPSRPRLRRSLPNPPFIPPLY
jgi:hypothetical protein